MNPFGAPLKQFMQRRGFSYHRGQFQKFLPDRALLVSVPIEPVRGAFAGPELLGYKLGLQVFYPVENSFMLISPGELENFRRDGTLRTVSYVSESSGIFQKTEKAAVVELLSEHFDVWLERLTNPECALSILAALRTRAELPPYMSYLEQFIAKSEEEKLEFARMQVPAVWLFDGGINFYAHVAYLNAGGRFEEAAAAIRAALTGEYFAGVRHSRVVMDATLSKLLADAEAGQIRLGSDNAAHTSRERTRDE